jgi:hypothetical protein
MRMDRELATLTVDWKLLNFTLPRIIEYQLLYGIFMLL